MRLLSWLLHLLVVALLFCALGRAQSQANAPHPLDSYLTGMNGGRGACADAACVNFIEGVNQNDLIVCSAVQSDVSLCTGGANPAWTFSDNIGFTWTAKTGAAAGSGTAKEWSQLAYACATSTQATYRASRTGLATGGCNQGMTCVRVKNACVGGTITEDDFQSTTQAVGVSGVQSVSTSPTTTRLNDLIVSTMMKSQGNGGSNRATPTGALNLVAGTDSANPNMGWEIAPSLGSNTITWKDYNAIHNENNSQSIAFQIPIVLGDSLLPQAISGIAYSAQLHCYGGTSASPTYALASGTLPTGVSLNTATGAITGTPSVTGTFTPGFTCTDGSSTSATDTMTILSVTSAGTPTVIASVQGALNNQGGTITLPGDVCGDVIVVYAYGMDTHGTTGYLQAIDGAGNFVHASDGSTVQGFLFNSGIYMAPLVAWVVGPIKSPGATVVVQSNSSASSALLYQAYAIRNTQGIADQPVANTVVGTANGSIAASYVTTVPNEYLMTGTFSSYNAETMSFAAPLASDFTGGSTFYSAAFGSALIASASSVTATTNISNSAVGSCNSFNFCNGWTTLVTALRPGAPSATCSVFVGAGEKTRRIIN